VPETWVVICYNRTDIGYLVNVDTNAIYSYTVLPAVVIEFCSQLWSVSVDIILK